MDFNKMLAELRTEREDIERAIISLERWGGKRKGRPPKWMRAKERSTKGEPKKKSS
jgi:hypothetical protein